MAIAHFICIKAGIAYTPARQQRLFEPDGGKTVWELEEADAPPHLFKRVGPTASAEVKTEEPKRKAKKQE